MCDMTLVTLVLDRPNKSVLWTWYTEINLGQDDLARKKPTELNALNWPERVSSTITEVEPAELIADEDISGPEACITLLPYVTDDFASRSITVVGVSVEISYGMIPLNQSDEFSRFAWAAADAESICISDLLPGFTIDFDQAQGEECWEEDGNEPDCADHIFVVD